MPKRPQLPPWLEMLYAELTKPPYFIQAKLSEVQNTEPEPGYASQPTGNQSNASTTASSAKETDGGSKPEAPNSQAGTKDSRQQPNVRRTSTNSRNTHTNNQASTLFIPSQVLDKYPFEVTKRAQQQSVLRVDTKDNLSYAVKRTTLPAQRVRFLNRGFNYAKKQGFNRFAPFVLSKKKSPVVIYDGAVYYATEWITGQSANFASPEQVAQVAYSLAQFHESTRGFISEQYSPPSAFDLFAMTRQRNRDLHQMMYRTEAKDKKDEFDSLFVSMKTDLFDDAADSLQLLQSTDCESFLAQDEAQPGLCHLDVIPGNCIYTPKHEIVLIDFDLATFAPRALDIAHLLRRSLERSNWNGDLAYACFLHFNTVKALPKAEYKLIEALIRFPYQAWRIAHTRYHFFAAEEQTDALHAYADQLSRRKTFLDSLSNQIERLSLDQKDA